MPKVIEIIKTEEEIVEGFFHSKITKVGTGAKISAPKEYIGRKVLVMMLR